MDSTATKFSPYYLMFGREPNLPIDIEFGVITPDLVATSTRNYVEKITKKTGMGFQESSRNKCERKKKEQTKL